MVGISMRRQFPSLYRKIRTDREIPVHSRFRFEKKSFFLPFHLDNRIDFRYNINCKSTYNINSCMNIKKDKIADAIREQINSGQYLPGDRLMTRTQLEEQFSVSSKTIQEAMDILIGEGYVEPRGKRGSFVSSHPPNLTRICLLFAEDFHQSCNNNHLFKAIRDELTNVGHRLNVTFELLDNAGQLKNGARIDKLLKDIEMKRIAGIFLLSNSEIFNDTPIINQKGIARVVLGTQSQAESVIYVDYLDFYRKAASVLQKMRCKRPLFLMDRILSYKEFDRILNILKHGGAEILPENIIMVNFEEPYLIENIIGMAFRCIQPPDALVLVDDNTLPAITGKLKQMGLESTPVIALANFPYPTQAAFKVTRIGFDVSKLLETATNSILAQVKGIDFPAKILIPAQIESCH